jgi:hypothetical protein
MTIAPRLTSVAVWVFFSASVGALAAAPPPAPPPTPAAPPTPVPAQPGVGSVTPSGRPESTPSTPLQGATPAIETAPRSAADATAAAPPPEAPAPPRVVPTADVAPAESDHDTVVGAWGIEVRPVETTLPVFARRAATGCPLATPAAAAGCPPVSVSRLGVRHWLGRNLAANVGVALALGGGSERGRLLDSYLGFGPEIGVSVLLGNWRHLAVAASPGLTFVLFKAAGSADKTYVFDLRADLEGELHLGFIGVPALSLGIRSGVLFRLEHAADVSVWSAGVAGATSVRGLVTDLLLRYYF